MVGYLAATLGAFTLALSFSVSSVDALDRGLGWATNNQYASGIGSKSLITWYHHWQDGPVPQMPGKNEYVPMYWGRRYNNLWKQRVAEMNKKTPKHLMAFNEPDVKGQSNMDPNDAAQLYMTDIYPWAKKDVLLGSPAIVWDLNWMDTFLNAVKQKGGHVDFICLHWYGSWNDIASFKKYVQTAHTRFGKNIWIPELGVTTASHPSQGQVKNFMMEVFAWLESQSYVERAAWFGSFESNHPPDNFATGLNALFNPQGQLSDMGQWYSSSGAKSKRSLRSRHHAIAARNATDSSDDPVHCDPTCQLRNSQIEEYYSQLPTA